MKYVLDQADFERFLIRIKLLVNLFEEFANNATKQENKDADMEKLLGNWQCTSRKSEFLIYKEGESYKVLLVLKKGFSRYVKTAVFRILKDGSDPFIVNDGKTLSLKYIPEKDEIEFSSNIYYIRKNDYVNP